MDLLDISGISNKNISYFNKLGIYNVVDLITYYPRKYNSYIKTDMSKVRDGDRVVLEGIVEVVPTVSQVSNKLKKIMFRVSDGNGIYNIVAFNLVYLVKVLRVGFRVVVIGKYERFKNTVIASEVRSGNISNEGEVVPIYREVDGINSKVILKCINNALNSNIAIVDYIPGYLCNKYNFLDKLSAIREIHNPSSLYNYKRAKQRLKYEEFFWYLVRIRYLKYKNNSGDSISSKVFDIDKVYKFVDELEFNLTVDQRKTLDEIIRDMKNDSSMNRLVQGDVGSGKTIVALISVYISYLASFQSALMVPTEILAVQHYHSALKLFENTDIRIGLFTSNLTKKERNKIINQLRDGEIDFVIGTHSLIGDDVIYNKLGLVIIDEQHRFGVKQRQLLKDKGIGVDVLSMSATPIPRTYALTIYGDMDVSSIKTKPVGRKEVSTIIKNESEILDVLSLMKREIDLGHQVYVVVPAIDNEDTMKLDNVRILEDKMKLAFGKVCEIGSIYGKMDSKAKALVMDRFERGEVKILISTTVIEVGVNVPNASMIVIFQANLFGLSTLHQLRGRVGRGSIDSYCVLVSKDKCDRLEIMGNTSDGFVISEYDFNNRGEGDLFGVKQSGDADFKLADLKADFNLLVRVRDDVLEYFNKYFNSDEYRKYLEMDKL